MGPEYSGGDGGAVELRWSELGLGECGVWGGGFLGMEGFLGIEGLV